MNGLYKAAVAATWIFVCLIAVPHSAAAQSVPAPWTSTDVGAPVLNGSATLSNGKFTVDAAGVDIWGTSDQFHFVYQAVSGDVDIRARVDSLTPVNRGTKAGLMIRSSLAANALHGSAFVSVEKGSSFQRRIVAGGYTTTTPGPMVTAPRWLRLVRVGSVLTGYQSSDGTNWQVMGSDTVPVGATAYVGIAVSSVTASIRTTAVVSSVTVTPLTAPTVPSGQASTDVGAPAVRGSTSVTQGTYTVSGAGANIFNQSDEFHFAYQPISGDVDIKVRVASVERVRDWSKAGVMIRESLAANAAHASMFVSAAKGYAFQRRPQTNALTEHSEGGSGTAPGWLRLVRTGSLFEAFRSTDGVNWVSVGSDVIPMNDDVVIGLAVNSYDVSRAAKAVFDNLTITQAAGTANKPPSVVISSPTPGATIAAATPVTIAATASDPDGTITGVEFYVNTTLVTRDTTAPYTATVSSLTTGTSTLKAVATDDKGLSTISSNVDVVVGSATPVSPTGVAFTVGADHVTTVSSYRLDVYRSGSTTVVSSVGLGKPAPSSTGDITVNLQTFFQALASGSYTATVTAIGSGGSTKSAAVSFTK